MNEPQVWTIIGIFGGTIVGLVTLIATLFTSTMKAGFERLDTKFTARFEIVDMRLDRLETKVDNLDKGIDGITKKIYGIDRD